MSSHGTWWKNESARFLLRDPAISLDASAPCITRRIETGTVNGCAPGALNSTYRSQQSSSREINERKFDTSEQLDNRSLEARSSQSMQPPLIRSAPDYELFSAYGNDQLSTSLRSTVGRYDHEIRSTSLRDDSLEQPRLQNATFDNGLHSGYLRNIRQGRNDSLFQSFNHKNIFETGRRSNAESSILAEVQNHSTPLQRMSSENSYSNSLNHINTSPAHCNNLNFGSDLSGEGFTTPGGGSSTKSGQDRELEENMMQLQQTVFELTDGGSRPTSRSSSLRATDFSSASDSLTSSVPVELKTRLNPDLKASTNSQSNVDVHPGRTHFTNRNIPPPASTAAVDSISTSFGQLDLNNSGNNDIDTCLLLSLLLNLLPNRLMASNEWGSYGSNTRFNHGNVSSTSASTSSILNLLAQLDKTQPYLLQSFLRYLEINHSELLQNLCKYAVVKSNFINGSPGNGNLLSYLGSLLPLEEVKNNAELMDMLATQGAACAARYDSAKSLQSNGYGYSSPMTSRQNSRQSVNFTPDYPVSPLYPRPRISDPPLPNKYPIRPVNFEGDIDRAATIYRNSANSASRKLESIRVWQGNLPMRNYNSMCFSRKVFLGGVPWDSTSDDLVNAFSQFGNVTVLWPQKDGGYVSHHNCSDAASERSTSPKGYCYLLFDNESCVEQLLTKCTRDPTNGGEYFKLTSPKFKTKSIQVIPWVISDSQFCPNGTQSNIRNKFTVFVGALHGMITAEALASIMNELFGNVIFAGLDTDKHKYPIGSGRVAFRTEESYMAAVQANFVEIKTPKFVKIIQIDPFLEDSLCETCKLLPGVYFCRSLECFRYFCPNCWKNWHHSNATNHKPLRRSLKFNQDRT
nr:growth factor receptor bound protein [Hymenolepis microstoma]